MGAIAFDTLKFAKRLKGGGFTESRAEALATAEAEFIEGNLATKQHIKELEAAVARDIAGINRDIKELEGSLKRDTKELDVGLERDLKDIEYRMTIKLGAMLIVAVGAMATISKLL